MRSTGCALCGKHPGLQERLHLRRLVPQVHFERNAFDLDPLGTAGAEVTLCEGCVNVLAAPMFLTEDLSRFAEIIALHREQHGTAVDSASFGDEGARACLFHRAVHLGMRALFGELSERPVAVAPRPEPDQLDLFSSKVARFAKVEEALARGDYAAAREACVELEKRHALPEAQYLAKRLIPIGRKAAAASGAEELRRLLDKSRALVEPERVTRGLFEAFERGLRSAIAARTEGRVG